MMTFLPLIKKRRYNQSTKIHGEAQVLQNLAITKASIIAIALDFSENDEKIIAHAVNQGDRNTTYVLLHIVESASAKYLGKEVDDDETRKDKQRLENYTNQLKQLNYKAFGYIGYRNRIKEITRIVTETKAEMLVMGAHRHTGIKDYLFGETIEAVRHELNIPVLIVNV